MDLLLLYGLLFSLRAGKESNLQSSLCGAVMIIHILKQMREWNMITFNHSINLQMRLKRKKLKLKKMLGDHYQLFNIYF